MGQREQCVGKKNQHCNSWITLLFHRETVNAQSNHCCGSIWFWSSLCTFLWYSSCAVLRMGFRPPEHFPAQRWGMDWDTDTPHLTVWQHSQWDCWGVLCQDLDSMIPVGPFQFRVFHDFMISIVILRGSDSMSQCQAGSMCHLSKTISTNGKGQGGYTEASPSTPMEYIVIPRGNCTKHYAWRQKWDKG